MPRNCAVRMRHARVRRFISAMTSPFEPRALSSDGNYLLVVTSPKAAVRGREGQLTRYVTESGYEEFETERLRVGRNPPAPQALVLLNLKDHSQHPLALGNLPGINEDPFKAIREENAKLLPASSAIPNDDKPKQRAITVTSDEPDPGAGGIQWSNTGHALAIQLLSVDNKDRWLVSVDFSSYSLVPQHRLSDTAWINESYNEFGWLNDDHTLWFLSEESGFSHLYVKDVGGAPRALTHGRFEASSPLLSTDGRWFYVFANAAAPYSYDVYRVSSRGGEMQRVSHLQGAERFSLSPSGRQLLIEHSSSYIRSQLALQSRRRHRRLRESCSIRVRKITKRCTGSSRKSCRFPRPMSRAPSSPRCIAPRALSSAARRPSAGSDLRARRRIFAGCDVAVFLLFPRADVQQSAGAAWLHGRVAWITGRLKATGAIGARPSTGRWAIRNSRTCSM